MAFYEEITGLILTNKIQTKDELHKQKLRLCKKYHINRIPPDSEILAYLSSDTVLPEATYTLLRKKPMRTISGVAIVAVMTSPESCPHGRCLPCPGGPEENTPQSYTGYEPAAMRASLNEFDPYLQTKSRLDQLDAIGHAIDKIDLILMGGTFTSRFIDYQSWYVKRCFDALNHKQSDSLEQAKKLNETASSRCIGLTVETRPDWFRLQQVDTSLTLGATRVELGVQSIYDHILTTMRRGHTVIDTEFATRLAKDSGLKVCYHLMPGLPGSNATLDLMGFKTVFQDERFKPDMIKIYPVLIIKGTELYRLWEQGKYQALETDDASELIAQMKAFVPEWVRIQRIQRDVPASLITAGVDKSNLRQIIEDKMNDHGTRCRCIRCREIGHQLLRDTIDLDELDFHLVTRRYRANGSDEVFLSFEDSVQDVIVGYLRLRDITCSHRYELSKKPCMIIRELKILGRELMLGERSPTGFQHQGYGKELLQEAERICLEDFDKKLLFVLS